VHLNGGMMPKVFWKPDEREAICFEAAIWMEANNSKSVISALEHAQTIVLSVDRHRPKTSLMTSVMEFRPLIADAIKSMNAIRAADEQRKIEEANRLEEDELAEQTRLRKEEHEEREAEERAQLRQAEESQALVLTQEEEVNSVVTERMLQPDFIMNIVRSLASQFENALVAELTSAAERAHLRVAGTLAEQVKAFTDLPIVKADRPRVLVMGFKSHLNHELLKEFREFLDLSFLTNEVTTKQLSNSAGMCDYVLVIKKFVSHAHTEAVSGHPGYMLINGSISTAREKLMELAIKHDDKNKE
jgi:hypothetical protein